MAIIQETIPLLSELSAWLLRTPAPPAAFRNRASNPPHTTNEVLLHGAVIDSQDVVVSEEERQGHEGMRIEALGSRDTLPTSFVVQLPMFNFSCRVERVWTSSDHEEGTGLWCGAMVSPHDIDTALAWRALVDKLPGSSVIH